MNMAVERGAGALGALVVAVICAGFFALARKDRVAQAKDIADEMATIEQAWKQRDAV